jgi:hypothetical protein
MEKGREPAMMALFKIVVDSLCSMLDCKLWSLRHELDLVFGRELSVQGLNVDLQLHMAHYMDRVDLEKYKIWFRGGLAYQWVLEPSKGRQLVSSANVYNPDSGVTRPGALPSLNYGSFVLTMDRDFYMARHAPGHENQFDGFYHSSYLGGKTAMAAGSMLIESGRVKRLRSDSGHYKPIDTNILAVLQAFMMVGVPIHDVVVEDHEGRKAEKAPQFMAVKADWGKIKQGREINLLDRAKADAHRKDILHPKPLGEAGEVTDTPY